MNTQPHKKKYIFVGSFSRSADGTIGGVQHCSRSLIESNLSDYVNWKLIDSTMKSLPHPNLFIRTLQACKRVFLMLKYLMFECVDGVLVFSSFGTTSLLEKGLLCILGKLFRKRVILSIHSNIKLSLISPFQRLQFLSKWYAKRVFNACDLIILSNDLASEAAQELFRLDPKSIMIIPNWIDPLPFVKPSTTFADEKSSQEKTLTFLYVGWLVKAKGVYELIDAFRILVEKKIRIRLLICGGGPEREALEQKCKEYNIQDNIEFCGWVSGNDKYEKFHEADAFVLPSYTEGMPISLLEAMVTGLPAIATPVGGIPVLIKQGENGFLVPTHQVEPLAEAIEELLQQPELMRQMGQRNQEYVLKHHNIKYLWKKFADAFQVDID